MAASFCQLLVDQRCAIKLGQTEAFFNLHLIITLDGLSPPLWATAAFEVTTLKKRWTDCVCLFCFQLCAALTAQAAAAAQPLSRVEPLLAHESHLPRS